MRMLKWLVVKGAFIFCIYLGFYQHQEGAYNVAMFAAWLWIALSPFSLSNKTIMAMRSTGRADTKKLSVISNFGIAVSFVFFGAWITGFFYLVAFFLIEVAWSIAESREDC